MSRHEAETESSKCTFEISGKLPGLSLTPSPGPLIETIVCVCPSRLEAQVVYLFFFFCSMVLFVAVSLKVFLDMSI